MSEPADVRPEPRLADGRAAPGRRRTERLVALLVVGVVLLNFPLLSMLRGRGQVAGVPALFVYLFAVWALLVAATALVLRGRSPAPGGPGAETAARKQ